MRALSRVVRALGVLAVVVVIVGPNLPTDWVGAWSSELGGKLRQVSFVQSWRMYAPNPQRAQTYMNLTAHYEDGTTRPLWETEQERNGWGTVWAWNKSREDIWRHYANFHPKRANDHRTWYLRAVCVREARQGPVPEKIVMEQVTRRFARPEEVAAGKPALGRSRRALVTVAYCKVKQVREMIEDDQRRRSG
ncbi:hypothetical protein [Paraliomyxa miuraensis]|uniref:hypothetical protein n=1 Tax=Paraliomyxa miuraensis TaxID=376150 RepID=UPI002259DDAF|nr:hypothetical protein [Paraliomyxa miuraensis]MCX4242426.1 hypothetical protein [Paraliomyxa miuraensis]